eukprot:842384-Pleurochrysis_carterae.AAC.2
MKPSALHVRAQLKRYLKRSAPLSRAPHCLARRLLLPQLRPSRRLAEALSLARADAAAGEPGERGLLHEAARSAPDAACSQFERRAAAADARNFRQPRVAHRHWPPARPPADAAAAARVRRAPVRPRWLVRTAGRARAAAMPLPLRLARRVVRGEEGTGACTETSLQEGPGGGG